MKSLSYTHVVITDSTILVNVLISAEESYWVGEISCDTTSSETHLLMQKSESFNGQLVPFEESVIKNTSFFVARNDKFKTFYETDPENWPSFSQVGVGFDGRNYDDFEFVFPGFVLAWKRNPQSFEITLHTATQDAFNRWVQNDKLEISIPPILRDEECSLQVLTKNGSHINFIVSLGRECGVYQLFSGKSGHIETQIYPLKSAAKQFSLTSSFTSPGSIQRKEIKFEDFKRFESVVDLTQTRYVLSN